MQKKYNNNNAGIGFCVCTCMHNNDINKYMVGVYVHLHTCYSAQLEVTAL